VEFGDQPGELAEGEAAPPFRRPVPAKRVEHHDRPAVVETVEQREGKDAPLVAQPASDVGALPGMAAIRWLMLPPGVERTLDVGARPEVPTGLLLWRGE
jgi:hypothetical protein